MTIFDVEVAPNRAMVGFMDAETKEIRQFQHDEYEAIETYVEGKKLVGFNSNKYDDIILTSMLNGVSAKQLYRISKDLIDGDGRPWDYPNVINSIDLIEVAPGQAGLKLYGGRLFTKQLQDLPYNPHEKHTKKMWKHVCKYNRVDLQVTLELYDALKPQLNLREKISKEYDINAMSRSDAQIAEDIFAKLVGRPPKGNIYRPKEVQYKAPKAVTFRPDLVKRIEKTKIKINPKNGQPIMPKWLGETVIEIGNGRYNIGLGGLHSMEKSTAVIGHKLGNIDVASMYPSLIITLGLYPKHLGKEFLGVYTEIRDKRIAAKRSGDKVTSDVLKIVLNGSYGKFGSQYSFLYSPDLMLQVTFTGQLYLLQLIEAMEDAGITVISANTDGIEYIDSDPKTVKKLVKKWEKLTRLEMEFGSYEALYSRDVNSYVAVYSDHVKAKGFYGEPTLAKNPEYPIVTEAIRLFLFDGTPLEETIGECKDPAQFCIVRTVRGGALWTGRVLPNTEEYDAYIKRVPFKQNKALEKRNEDYQKQFLDPVGDYLGKVVRFYYSTDGRPMYYKESGNRVPKSEGCRPMMKLPNKLPKDIDYDRYLELSKIHLKECGYEEK